MGFKLPYLSCLGALALVLLGGCGWVSELQSSNRLNESEAQNAQADMSGEPGQELLHVESSPAESITDAPVSAGESDSALNSSSASSSEINHGERLSTLDDDLPPGRLPPEIVPATGDFQRLPLIEPGRRDPFASLPTQPFLVPQRAVASSSVATPAAAERPAAPSAQPAVPSSPQSVIPVPVASQLPSLPIVPTPSRVVPQPVPTVPVVTAPESTQPASEPGSVSSSNPTSPSFEFSGVVQMGDRVNIIVEEPSGSRYVQVGERVGNGQFVIKSVDFNQGATPAVILERGGTETVHWVGSPISM